MYDVNSVNYHGAPVAVHLHPPEQRGGRGQLLAAGGREIALTASVLGRASADFISGPEMGKLKWVSWNGSPKASAFHARTLLNSPKASAFRKLSVSFSCYPFSLTRFGPLILGGTKGVPRNGV